MAKIHNSKIQERIIRDVGLQLSRDAVPNEIASKVVPVIISNPLYARKTLLADKSTTGVMSVALPTDKDIIVRAIHYFWLNDNSSNSGTNAPQVIKITGTGEGDINIFNIATFTYSGNDNVMIKEFGDGLLVLKGGTLTESNSNFTGGKYVRSFLIEYSEVI